MKAEGINGWKYLEHWYLKIIKMYLTQEWALIQGGKDSYAVRRWLDIMLLFEVDLKAQKELMLLAQSGDVGRTCANKIIWDLLSSWGLMYDYGDLSHKISSWGPENAPKVRQATSGASGHEEVVLDPL